MSSNNNGPCTSSGFDFVPPSLYFVLSTLFSVTTAYGTYKYIRYHRDCDIHMKPPKSLFIIGLIFFLLSVLYLFSFGLVQLSLIIECTHTSPDVWQAKWRSSSISVWLLTNICYYAHVYLLWLNLFTRISFVFNGTEYAISSLTANTYRALLVALPFLIPLCLLLAIALDGGIIVIWLFYLFSISFSVSLSMLFVYKLKQTFRSSRSAAYNYGTLSVIVKHTILCVVSTVCTVFVLLSTMIYQKLFTTLTLLDMLSNVACIYFTYRFSEKEYYKFCGCLDHQVRLFLKTRGFRITPVPSPRDKHDLPQRLVFSQQATQSVEIVESGSPDDIQVESKISQEITSNDANSNDVADL